MPTLYIEEYSIDGHKFAVEDHEDGQPAEKHFFHNHYLSGEGKRFHCWHNGCGVGQFDTLADARFKIRDYALNDANRKYNMALDHKREAIAIIDALSGDDIFKLAAFLAKEPDND